MRVAALSIHSAVELEIAGVEHCNFHGGSLA